MTADELIVKLGDSIGIELEFSSEGTCSVIFDEDEIAFEKNNEQLLIIATVSAQLKNDAELYRTLLAANYLGIHTGFSTLSIDENRNELILHRLIEEKTDFDVFEKILVMFLKSLRYWKKWLAEENENSSVLQNKDEKAQFDLLKSGIKI